MELTRFVGHPDVPPILCCVEAELRSDKETTNGGQPPLASAEVTGIADQRQSSSPEEKDHQHGATDQRIHSQQHTNPEHHQKNFIAPPSSVPDVECPTTTS
jgi:hypothetical protein